MNAYSRVIMSLGSVLIGAVFALSSAAQSTAPPSPGTSGSPLGARPGTSMTPESYRSTTSPAGPESAPGSLMPSPDSSSGQSDFRSIIEPGPATSAGPAGGPAPGSRGGIGSAGVQPDFGGGTPGTTGAGR